MNFKIVLLLSLLQLTSLSAMAMGQRLHGEGDISVSQSFTVKGTSVRPTKSSGEKAVFPAGKYKFEISSATRPEFDGSCVPLMGCRGENKYVSYLYLRAGNKSISFVAPFQNLKDGTLALYAKDSRQSFNIFIKETKSESKENYTREKEECEVELYRTRGGFYGGSRDIYGVGEQWVRRHDEVTRKTYAVRFVDAATNKTLASFTGKGETRTSQVDSVGECELNR